MKKLYNIFMVFILSISLVGCSNNTNTSATSKDNVLYEKYIADGKSSVVDEEYDKAIEHFELALEEKKDDKEATNLIKQLLLLKESIELNEGESGAYFNAIENLEKIYKIKTNSNVVKKKAATYKENVLANLDTSIDYEEDLIESGDYEKAKKDLEMLIEELKKYASLKEQLDRCENLLKKCNTKSEESKANSEQYENVGDAGDTVNGKVYCFRGDHYVDPENLLDSEQIGCKGCFTKRNYSSTSMNRPCPNCGDDDSVSQFTGICWTCNKKTLPAVKNIYDDGTVIYEDGSKN